MGGYRCDKINAGAQPSSSRGLLSLSHALIFNNEDDDGVVWLEKRER